MSYRRKTEDVKTLQRFKKFGHENEELIAHSGLPLAVATDFEVFVYFLGHGSTWPIPHVQFNLEEMDQEQRRAYLRLVAEFLQAGFGDPGLAGITAEEREALTASST